MPNWVSNRLKINSNKDGDLTGWKNEDINEILEIFSNDFPFNKIIPEPDWSRLPEDIPTHGEYMKATRGENFKFNTPSPFLESILGKPYDWNDLKDKTKPDERCLEWRKRNWDTKWDLKKEDIQIKNYLDTHLYVEISFDTAWSPPYGIYKRLLKDYGEISWLWDQEEFCECGYLNKH